MPRSRAARTNRSSSSGASTANAPLTASAVAPRPPSSSSASATSESVTPAVASTKTCSVASLRPGARPMSPTRGALARHAKRRPVADPDDTDRADVPFEQGVHRLRRREGDELDTRATLAELGDELTERGGDALRDTGACAVGRGDADAGVDLERRRRDGDGLREGPTDVDADPQTRSHARATRPRPRRMAGRTKNTRSAPRT